jgi:hypothetical protein
MGVLPTRASRSSVLSGTDCVLSVLGEASEVPLVFACLDFEIRAG